jgi:hypothetical protein
LAKRYLFWIYPKNNGSVKIFAATPFNWIVHPLKIGCYKMDNEIFITTPRFSGENSTLSTNIVRVPKQSNQKI